MKVKTSELTGDALDWSVAVSIGESPRIVPVHGNPDISITDSGERFNPSGNWSQCGPLIEKYHVDVNYFKEGDCVAQPYGSPKYMDHIDPKIAICRAVVASVLGDEIELPEGLQ